MTCPFGERRLQFLAVSLISLSFAFSGGCSSAVDKGPKKLMADWAEKKNPTMEVGESRAFEVILTNQLGSDLKIEKIHSGCSCTVFDVPSSPLGSGKKCKIKITYNSSGKSAGPQTIPIVITDASGQTHSVLQPLALQITQAVSLGRYRVLMPGLLPGEDFATVVAISEASESKINWPKVTAQITPDWLSVTMTAAPSGSAFSHQLDLKGKVPWKSGQIKGKVQLRIPIEKQERPIELDIPLEGHIRRLVEPEPAVHFLGRITPDQELELGLNLSTPHHEPITLDQVIVPGWWTLVKSDNSPVKNGTSVRLLVRFGESTNSKSSGEKIQFKGHCGADPWETDVQCVFILGPKLQSDDSSK